MPNPETEAKLRAWVPCPCVTKAQCDACVSQHGYHADYSEPYCSLCIKNQVPKHPALWDECPCEFVYDGINHYLDATDGNRCCKMTLYEMGHKKEGCDCCGTGLAFQPTLERLLEALLPLTDVVIMLRDGQFWVDIDVGPPKFHKADTPEDAVGAAVVAVGQRGELGESY